MELIDNPYSAMQKRYYEGTFEQMKNNHSEHNDNPDYWNLLLLGMSDHPEDWKDKSALDFGCGQGRNVIHMRAAAPFKKVDGVDISSKNCEVARYNTQQVFGNDDSTWYTNNGYDLNTINDGIYDLVISTITLQHICVYKIRHNLLKEIFRVLKPGGTFSFQMGYGEGHQNTVDYISNKWDAQGTNSFCDVKVKDEQEVLFELNWIGFENCKATIVSSRRLDSHNQWIFIKCNKPIDEKGN